MKTTNYLFAAVALSIAFVSCQKETIEPMKPAALNVREIPAVMDEGLSADAKGTISVRYEISINMEADKPLCNRYQVELLDATGHQVLPAQIYVPGTKIYNFYEQTRLSKGVRIARLVVIPFDQHYICETELFTVPVSKLIQFVDGETYSYALYPETKPNKGDQ